MSFPLTSSSTASDGMAAGQSKSLGTPPTAAGLSRPEINQLKVSDRAAHDWYRFVLSFPPHLVQQYVERFGVSVDQTMLDPFCGTGTTVVEAKKLGIPSVGVEANPMAQFAGSVKVDWAVDPDGLEREAIAIAEMAQAESDRVADSLRHLSEEQQALLLKNSISPLPLHKVLILREFLDRNGTDPYRRHLRLALARTVVSDASNLSFGPEVGIGKPKADAPVVQAWLARVKTMANDLRSLSPLPRTEAIVHPADSRSLNLVLMPNSIDAVITSPPYPNEKDYTRATRLESVILGFLSTKADLRALKQGLMRSNTRNVYKGDRDDQWVAQHPQIQAIATEIEERRIAWNKTSGFERLYARAVTLYFGGMARHLAELRPKLRSGAQLAYVVGDQKSYLQVMIRTGELLATIAEGLGYEVVNIDLFRTRLATATKEQMREEVVVLRWPGQMPNSQYPYGDLNEI